MAEAETVAKRDWTIESTDYETEDEFRAAVAEELARHENSGYRLGFALVAAPIRQRVGDGIVTLGWRFEAHTVPLVGGPPQQAGPLPEVPEPEEEADHATIATHGADVEPEPEVPVDEPEPVTVPDDDPYAEEQ